MPSWLRDAVFYEIYPQSFYDTNGDGIGDFHGIMQKLDYIKSLGCNALWINPCFDSPFNDAGYDVRDYKMAAPRYGTNEDLFQLFQEAHKRGIHVLLDLVPGHTSEEHEWFKKSSQAQKNVYSNRYIWTDFCFKPATGFPYIAGESDRNGAYLLNFFKCQPALNYGFLSPKESWQLPTDHPDCIATREAMKDVMRFWLSHGCDGFRVDMAFSLVKNDDKDHSGTSAIWRDVRAMLDTDYPEAAMVSEWSDPSIALNAGFHMDFYLNSNNGYTTLMRDYDIEKEDKSYFKTDGSDISRFLADYLPKYKKTKDIGYISFITGNHDTIRARYNLSVSELKLAYAFLLTMPGVPFIYYGDEIGMRYQDLPTKEGGYFRTGSRTPMQWNHDKNLGFSAVDPNKLYLPVDGTEGAPTVADEQNDPDSLWNTVHKILMLRHKNPDLQADGSFEVYETKDRLFAYRRGNFLLTVNPSKTETNLSVPFAVKTEFELGSCSVAKDGIIVGPQSFCIFKPTAVNLSYTTNL